MTNNKPAWKLNADPKRQATDALRGYLYQVWQTLHAWLELRAEQVLYLEGAEDFDVIDETCGRPVQVKDTHANITLRTESVTDAISNFWRLCKAHPNKTITFQYLTRSSIGVEKNAPFGPNRGGLTLWQKSYNTPETVVELAGFLCKDSITSERLPPDLLQFLRNSPSQDIYDRLIKPLEWITDSQPVETVTLAIDRKLINYGQIYNILPSECIKVTDSLLRQVLTVATRKNINDRKLNFADFAMIFEKATSVTVPRKQLDALLALQNSFGSIPIAIGGCSLLFQAPGTVSVQHSLPPLPPTIAPREKLVNECKSKLTNETLLFISASTGTGKSTLAKLTAHSFGHDWVWFSFSNFHGEHYPKALMQAARAIDDLPYNTHIILDDIVFDSSTIPEWEQILGGLFYTVRARHIRVIATSQKPLPIGVRNTWGVSESVGFIVPDFDESETTDFCMQLGCDNSEKAQKHAKMAMALTSGHPQLIHAHLLTLSRQGWPEVTIDSLSEASTDVKELQSQARQLLNNLSPDEKDLLYRTSIARGTFRREHIVQLGETAKLSLAGDIFDRLVGPWIKKSSNGRFELSQLLQNAASAVWSKKTLESIHHEMADAILSEKSLAIEDGANALYHAFVGKHDWALLMLTNSLVTGASEEVKKAVAKNAFWFLNLATEDKKGHLYPSKPTVSLMLRMLQFRLCVATDAEKALKALDAWEEEMKSLDDSPENLLSWGLFLVSAILYSQVRFPLPRVLKLFESLALLRKRLKPHAFSKLVDSNFFTHLDRDGKPINTFAPLFGINAMRCNTRDDLTVLLSELARLDNDLREELLGAFNLPDGYASAYVSNVYLNEGKAIKPNWESCVSVFIKTIDYATEWEAPGLGAAAARFASVIIDEELHKSDEALEILDDGVKRFPSQAWILEAQRGTVFLRAKRYQDATLIFSYALEGREIGCHELLYNPLYSFRNAGIAAANAGSWDISANFFHRGSQCAAQMNKPVFFAAFQTDAAYAYWQANLKNEMLVSLRMSVDLIDTMNRDKADLGAYWVYRVTTNTVNWLREFAETGKRHSELTMPLPGMCSTPERNEDIFKLPDVPFELTLLFLIQLERALQAEPIALTKYGSRLDKVPLPTIALFMSNIRIEETLKRGSLKKLPVLLDNQIRGYLASRKIETPNKIVWNRSEINVSDQQVRATLLDQDFLTNLFLAATVLIFSGKTNNTYAKHCQEWRDSASSVSWHEDLIKYLEKAETLHDLSATDLLPMLREGKTTYSERLLVSLFLAQAPSKCDLRELLQMHFWLFDHFTRSCFWGKDIEESLSALIASTWAQRAKTRFALSMPQLTVPPLEAACSIPEESFNKAANVLMQAANAIGSSLPKEFVDQYRRA